MILSIEGIIHSNAFIIYCLVILKDSPELFPGSGVKASHSNVKKTYCIVCLQCFTVTLLKRVFA